MYTVVCAPVNSSCGSHSDSATHKQEPCEDFTVRVVMPLAALTEKPAAEVIHQAKLRFRSRE
jgi:hypothetical protein